MNNANANAAAIKIIAAAYPAPVVAGPEWVSETCVATPNAIKPKPPMNRICKAGTR